MVKKTFVDIFPATRSHLTYTKFFKTLILNQRQRQMLTERLAAVQSGGEATGVGVGRNVGGGGVQHGVSDDDGVDDALTGDGAERHGRLVR